MTPSEILLNRELDAIHKTMRWMHFNFKTGDPGPDADETDRKVNKVCVEIMGHILGLLILHREAAYELELALRTRSGGSIVDLTLEKFEYLPLEDGRDNYDRLMDRKPVEGEHDDEHDEEGGNFFVDWRARQHQKVEELLSNPPPTSCLGPDGKLGPDLLTYDRRCYGMWLRVVAEHALLQQLIAALSYGVLYVHAKLETDTNFEEAHIVADEMLQCTQAAFDGNLETWLDEATKKSDPIGGTDHGR